MNVNQIKYADNKITSFIETIYQGENSSSDIESTLKEILSKIKIGKLNFLIKKFFDKNTDVLSNASKVGVSLGAYQIFELMSKIRLMKFLEVLRVLGVLNKFTGPLPFIIPKTQEMKISQMKNVGI